MTTAVEGKPGEGDTGVAGLALECDGAPYRGGSVDYFDGLAEVQKSKDRAVVDWISVLGFVEVPGEGYRQERDEGERVLLSYDVAGQTKVAVVLADGMSDYLDNEGWGVEWWAQCDPAELPASVTEALGIGVWQDQLGERVPVTKIRSSQGPAHCDWQDITFLRADLEPSVTFVRDTEHEFVPYLTTTFAVVDRLPDGASDTGYRRNGRSLWLDPNREAAYLLSDADPSDIERWPAEAKPIGCA